MAGAKHAKKPAPEAARVVRRPRAASARGDETRPLDDPSLYLNRELSLLEFNRRVLAQAKDEGTPLLERLRFLTISFTNLDEFFEIRVGGLKQQVDLGVSQLGPDALTPIQTLERISEVAHGLVEDQYRTYRTELRPALEEEGIRLLDQSQWTPKQARWIKRYFARGVAPVLSPMALDPAHPFPNVINKGLSFVVSLDGPDAFGRTSGIAVIHAPRSLPRLVALPKNVARGPYDFVLLSQIIQAHVGDVFPGMEALECHPFRVTRNSDLWVDEEEVDDLLRALEGELPRRNYGDAVRLEVGPDCTPEVARFLLDQFDLEDEDLYQVDGPVNLHRLAAIYFLVQRADLKYAPFVAGVPKRLSAGRSFFDVLKRGEVLLHHPFESFTPVVDFLRKAAIDPSVVAIKQTLYRTDADSPVVDALIAAARSGKEVTVVVELRARFDEAANIDLATRLQDAGINVVYGIVGYKAHAKMLLVVRREGRRLRRYVHLGTGNYHSGTARAYTDLSYLTADLRVCEDVHRLFLQLTGLGKATRLQKLLQSPFTLHKRLLALIENEAEQARSGKTARIVARMNALSEATVIQALYRASQAGVKIDLIVRGTCCLKPGIPGVSENIRVRSIVGRFLEHTRCYHFHAAGESILLASSADWLDRNLFRRVEACFPIEDEALRRRAFTETLGLYLEDNTQAWLLQPDGRYRRARPGNHRPRSAQQELLERHAD
jgi:polyphosphate kinase